MWRWSATGSTLPPSCFTARPSNWRGDAGVLRWHLSLTHTDQVAMAVVVAEGGGRTEDAIGPGAPGRVLPADRAAKP